MKKNFIWILLLVAVSQSCKKIIDDLHPVSSFTVVNATTDITSAKVYASGNTLNWNSLPATEAVAQYRSVQLGVFAGNNLVKAVSATDTMINLFNMGKTEEFRKSGFSTLFLCGSSGSYDGVLINNDNIVNYTDSVIGIRFINLSPNSSYGLNDPVIAEDIVHQVFLKLLTSAAVIGIKKWKAYLFIMLRNELVNHYRKDQVQRRCVRPGYSGVYTNHDHLLEKEYCERMINAIKNLPPKQSLVFKLSCVYNLNDKKIAQIMGISPATVKHQRKTVKQKLMKLVA